jgi:2-polyprenyl-3-methyl-5-hydroxy-6-metoxy-1,4-benzoquinol methylase
MENINKHYMLNQTEHINHFSKIYETNEWGGSGSGSFPDNTVTYREFIKTFLEKKKITTVIDYGCGDWQFSKLIDWSNVSYIGLDCVKSLIDYHNSTYKTDNICFVHASQTSDTFKYTGDLLILKDVLQHWLNDEIIYFLDNIVNNFKYVLITNSSDQTHDWQDTPARSRPLSCDFFPLKKYNIKKKALITNQAGNKEISLITRK